MAISTRRPRGSDEDVWPGFVDALSQLVMIIVFVLMMFTAAQFFLSSALSGRNSEVSELSRQLAELQAQLGLVTNDRDRLTKSVSDLSAQLQIANAERDRLTEQVAALGNKADDATAAARSGTAELQARLGAAQQAIAQRDAKLSEAQGKLGEAQSTIDQLNAQILALRQQLEKVVAALDASEAKGNEQQIQIADLGRRLNLALANKVEELAKYRSEFFGRLRAVLGDRPDIRIVGDRFVFQSEVLFSPASADLSDDAKKRLLPVAQALKDLADKIPPDLNWVLRVDGHTDKRPINTPQFPSNWELSTARAISVVRYFIDQGIPANRLAAAGFADQQPLDPGNDEAAFARNRRIELKLTER